MATPLPAQAASPAPVPAPGTDIPYQPLLFTVLLLAIGAVIFLLLRRRLVIAAEEKAAGRVRLRLAGGGILLVVLLVLVRLWTDYLETLGYSLLGRRLRLFSEQLLWTALAGIGCFLAARQLQRLVLRDKENLEARHRVRRLIAWLAVVLFAVVAVFIWINQLENLGVFLGIVGAGLALSLQESVLCLVGWLLIITRRPFDVGDRIKVGAQAGDVIDISVFQTTLLEIGGWSGGEQSTGRLLIIPNSVVFRQEIFNYTKGFPFIWNEFPVVVTFESDWQRARELMLAQAQEEAEKFAREVERKINAMQSRYAIRYTQLTPTVYVAIDASGVRLDLRYLCPVRERRTTEDRIARGILAAFAAEGKIDFAYPTTRLFRNPDEGKPDLR